MKELIDGILGANIPSFPKQSSLNLPTLKKSTPNVVLPKLTLPKLTKTK